MPRSGVASSEKTDRTVPADETAKPYKGRERRQTPDRRHTDRRVDERRRAGIGEVVPDRRGDGRRSDERRDHGRRDDETP